MRRFENEKQEKLKQEIIEDLSSSSYHVLSSNNLSDISFTDNVITLSDTEEDESPHENICLLNDIYDLIKSNDANFLKRKRSLYPNQKNKISSSKSKVNNISSEFHSNNLEKINNSYEQLKKLLSKYSFHNIINYIIQINNGVRKENVENKELYMALHAILQNFNHKEDLILLLLSIVNENVSTNIKKEKDKDLNIMKQPTPNFNSKNNEKENSNIDAFDLDINKIEYLIVLKNYKYEVHSYLTYNIDRPSDFIVPCENKDCKAVCFLTENNIYPKGKHIHLGKSRKYYESRYPELAKKSSWKYVKIFKYNGEELVFVY